MLKLFLVVLCATRYSFMGKLSGNYVTCLRVVISLWYVAIIVWLSWLLCIHIVRLGATV